MTIQLPPVPNVQDHALTDHDGTMTPLFAQWFTQLYNIIQQAQFAAPATATFILQTANSLLTNAQVLANLNSGIVKVTTNTGLLTSEAIIQPTEGGTGVNNGTSKLTISNDTSFIGGFPVSISTLGPTSVTLPLTGTLSTTVGTITSITFTGDGTIFSTNPTAPITTSGTLTPTLLVQNSNTALMGPSSGSTSTPSFRKIVVQDVVQAVMPLDMNIYSYCGGV